MTSVRAGVEHTFKFMAWNIDQAMREQQHEPTKWAMRAPRVKQLINDVAADIVALVELRDLPDNECATTFLGSFPQYDSVRRRYCHYENTFQMALMFDPKKLFLGDVRVHNYENAPGNDKMVMFVDLQCKRTLQWITVGVTHFALGEDEKWRSTRALRDLIAHQAHPCAVYGDYNFFDDMDGRDMRDFMLDLFVDLAHPLHHCGSPLSGTFLGFTHDEHRKTWDDMSRLDHIIAHRGVRAIDKAYSPNLTAYMVDNSAYATMTYPSDHLAIVVDLAFVDCTLRRWQDELEKALIADVADIHTDRGIHIIIDPKGNLGKSHVIGHLVTFHNAKIIPSSCTTADDMVQAACDQVHEGWEGIFVVDMPRATSPRHWWLLCQGIETIRQGFLYDKRYSFKEVIIEPPTILVVCNHEPVKEMLTPDRWIMHSYKDSDDPEEIAS